MYCTNCGKQIDESNGSDARFCEYCGAPFRKMNPEREQLNGGTAPTLTGRAEEPAGSATGIPTMTGMDRPPMDRLPDPPGAIPEGVNYAAPGNFGDASPAEENGKDKKALIIALIVIIAALLLVCILLAIRYFGGRKDADPVSGEEVSTVEEDAEKEEAFRESLSLVDVSSFPQNSSSGYFETYCGDLSDDGEPEYVGFYGDFSEEQSSVDLRLYEMETDEPEETDRLEEPINTVVGGNGALSICVFCENGHLYVFRSFCAYGGSRWGNEYICFSVQDGELVEDYHFTEFEFPRYDQFTYEETVSGTTYASSDELQAAVEERGPAPHSHDMTVDENGNPTEAPTEGHIFILYHNRDFNEAGETGYIRLFGKTTASETQPTEAGGETAPAATNEPAATSAPPADNDIDVASLWKKLDGWWNCPNGTTSNFYTENGKYYHTSGLWASEGTWPAYVTEITPTGVNGVYRLNFHCDAHTEYDSWVEAYDYSFELDISELDNKKITIISTSGKDIHVYAGTTMDEAERHFYENYHDALVQNR